MDPEYTDKFLSTVKAATITPQEPLVTLHAVYDAIIKGDFDGIGGFMTDDVELNINGFVPLDGTWKGRREVIAASKKNFAQVGSQQPVIEGMISQGDSVAVLMRESGVLQSTGQAYSIRGVQWFTFAGGKIRKIDQVTASILKAAH
jgi:ketosteroid isomerase-like protein